MSREMSRTKKPKAKTDKKLPVPVAHTQPALSELDVQIQKSVIGREDYVDMFRGLVPDVAGILYGLAKKGKTERTKLEACDKILKAAEIGAASGGGAGAPTSVTEHIRALEEVWKRRRGGGGSAPPIASAG